MEAVKTGLGFVTENRDLIAGMLVSIIALVKVTAWGRAKAAALDAVTRVIERLGANSVKQAVAEQEAKMTAGALDALQVSVAKADPKKTAPGPVTQIVREVFRGVLPKKG